MRFHPLLSVLLLCVTIIPKGNTGLVPGTKRCTMLKGKCHEKGCTTTEHKMGECSRRKVCCRKWWIYGPYPTPVPKAKPS
ncbi:beta-defensin 130B isoform X2 [Dipodomys merriami]|uniref:beta-defensin 130B isoform X2 n=1 Tax=Dipodomys merriami TaxID=94247 RepID=UPI00384A71D0